MASQNSAALTVTFIDYCKSCLVSRLPVLYKLVFIVQFENTRLYSSQQDLKRASTLQILLERIQSCVFKLVQWKAVYTEWRAWGRGEKMVSVLPSSSQNYPTG